MLWLAAKPAYAQSAFKGVHLFETPTTQATAGGTTTLTLASQTVQRFTGTQNQTVVLPNATTLSVGMYFLIANDSTGVLTVNNASSGLVATVLASNSVSLRLITNGSAAGVWTVENNYTAIPASEISGIVPLANGGTALSNVASQGGIAYGTSSGISLTAAQTSGQAIISQGTAAPIGFNPTSGAVLFAGTAGAISQSANTFSWDQNNTRLTVGGGSNTVTVGGAAKNSVLSLSGTRASNEYELGIHKHSATLNPGMYMLRSRGSEATPSIVQNGDLLGVMDGLGFDGTDYEIGAQIDYVVDGVPGSNDMPGAILFKTTPDGSATPATAATISNDKTLTLYGALDTALTTSGVVLTGSSGILSSRAQLDLLNGGTNNNIVVSQGGAAYGTASGISLTAAGVSGTYLKSNGTSAPTFQAIQAATDISGILPLANGGTNANITASHGGLAYSTATAISVGPVASAGKLFVGAGAGAYALTAVGTSGQYLKSEGAATPIWKDFVAPTVQRFYSGSAQTYTLPAGAKYIRVQMIGGGGGGGGGSTSSNGTDGTAGTATTFGTSFLTAAGGSGGARGNTGGSQPAGGAGGSPTVITSTYTANGISQIGGGGMSGSNVIVSQYAWSGEGCPGVFGGGGAGGFTAGVNAAANSGAGGSGGGNTGSAGQGGAGGGCGAYIDVIITNPAATYTYTVGGGGAGGAGAGTGSVTGGNGGSGLIVVTEYYQ